MRYNVGGKDEKFDSSGRYEECDLKVDLRDVIRW